METLSNYLNEGLGTYIGDVSYYNFDEISKNEREIKKIAKQIKADSISIPELYNLMGYSGELGGSPDRVDKAVKELRTILKKMGIRKKEDADVMIKTLGYLYLNGGVDLPQGFGYVCCVSCPSIESIYDKPLTTKEVLKQRSKAPKDEIYNWPVPRSIRGDKGMMVPTGKKLRGRFDAIYLYLYSDGELTWLQEILYKAAGVEI